jgi:deazaflavin-dependent oxidoreductase (nitroreductase family)
MLYGQEHVKRYQETDGEVGHEWNGVNTLILTTTGRKSGEERSTPLIYGTTDDENPVIVASNGGSQEPPGWFANLSEDPDVNVQVGPDRFRARARTATPDEKPALWEMMAGIWPKYDEYQEKTDREIPVVVLERQS